MPRFFTPEFFADPYSTYDAIRTDPVYWEDELEPIFEGNAYGSDAPRVPTTLREAAELFAGSEIAREAFGADVVNHYLNNARIEVAAFDSAITDWERVRGFERF